MNDAYDIIVVGAGIVGVSTALHLQQRGRRVLLLDKQEPGRETSFGNSGNIESSYVLPFTPPAFSKIPGILLGNSASARMSYPSGLKFIPWVCDFYLKSRTETRIKNGHALRPLIAPSVEEHKKLMQGTDAAKYFHTTGRVKIHRSQASFQSAALERDVAREEGVPFEVLGVEAFREREPHIRPVFYKAVCWTGSARLSDPGAVVVLYAGKFTAAGGTFKADPVKAVAKAAGGWHVQCAGQGYAANDVVVCAGPWSPTLLKPLGYNPPLGLKRGYHRHFTAAEGKLSHNITDADAGYVMSPMEQGIRIATGAEFASLDAPANDVQISQVLPHARELFPLGEAVEKQSWMGSRPCFTDSLPAIGMVKGQKGLWVNIGHGHSGLTIGPSSGRLIAEMMTGDKPFCDPTPYSPMRFV